MNKCEPYAKGERLPNTPKQSNFVRLLKRDWQMHLLILLPVIYCIIFYYYPLYGLQIAFRDYRAKFGILGSPWVGLKWFKKFLTNYKFSQIVTNTIVLSLYDIIAGFPLPIILALLLNTMQNEKVKRVTQTITYIPHFISVVVLVAILNRVFSPMNGLYGAIYRLFGGEGFPADIRAQNSAFRHLFTWSSIWQELGWDTIIYTAALSGISPELHEAAQIDGASRFQRILHVELPAILPTACILLILRTGSIMTVGFEKVYLMQGDLNLSVSEVISTYVYKAGMGSSKDFSYGTAIGLFNSVVNIAMMLFVNLTVKKASSDDVSLL